MLANQAHRAAHFVNLPEVLVPLIIHWNFTTCTFSVIFVQARGPQRGPTRTGKARPCLAD